MDAVEAVARAKQHVEQLFYGDTAGTPALEEVVPDGAIWKVTLSFQRARPLKAGGLGLAMDPELTNYHKVVRIERETGDLISVTNAEQ